MNRLIFIAAICFAAIFGHAEKANATACTAGCIQFNTGAAFSGTTVSSTLTGVTAGSNIRAWLVLQPNTLTVSGVTFDGGAGTGPLPATPPAQNGKVAAFAFRPNSASGSITVTATLSAACANCGLLVEEWAGDAATSPGDGSNGTGTTGSTGASLPCGSITTTGSNDSIEVVLFQAQSAVPTNPAGYTTAVNNFSTTGFLTAYITAQSASTYNPTFVGGTNSFDNIVMCGAFKAAGGGASVIPGALSPAGPLIGVH